MDELSPFGPTRVTVLERGRLEERTLRPEDFGLAPCAKGATDGGDARENAAILESILEGTHHPSRNAFLLNAAAALCVYDGLPPKEATAQATTALTSGAALTRLQEWRQKWVSSNKS